MKITASKIAKSRLPEIDFSNLSFGKIMTDHMALADYSDGEWKNPRIVPYENLSLSPATSALHYGQSVFEGMKAFKNSAREIFIFRANSHADRLNKSLLRLAMPQIPAEIFTALIRAYLNIDRDWVPTGENESLYIRPFVFATDSEIGLHPSKKYTFCIFGSPSGSYYSKPLKLKIEEKYSRTTAGGTGFAKAAGNYAGAMLPTELAAADGFDQILWTDSSTHSFVEESGTMNIIFVIDGAIVTPETGETILSGITRDSLLTIARDMGIKVEERKISVAEIISAFELGKITEAFGTGTAATVASIESITFKDKEYKLPIVSGGAPAPANGIVSGPQIGVNMSQTALSAGLYKNLCEIKTGQIADPYNWVEKI